MRKIFLVFVIFACLPTPAFAGGVDFIFDVRPASILFSSDLDGFYVSRSGSYSYESYTIDGDGSWIPTARAGIGIDAKAAYIDFLLGIGYLWNNAFSGASYQGDVGAHFKLGPVVTLGPHLGFISFSQLDWAESGPSSLTFDSTSGVQYGVDFTIGKKIFYKLSFDWLRVDESPITELSSGWTPSRNSIDLSGFALQMGIQGRF